MNDVKLYGVLTKDPYIRHAEGEGGYDLARFTVRVEQGTREDGKSNAENINLVAFRKVAELAEKKLKKDMAVLVSGHIHSGSYTDREGNTVLSQSIVADKIDIVTANGLENMGPEAMQTMPETMGDLPFSGAEY
ncbi:MAG: single-stranded DNA-binding protein [Eubacterium sp.]|nr:single-stranded DNA-binding protein [Eubacterium sp.]